MLLKLATHLKRAAKFWRVLTLAPEIFITAVPIWARVLSLLCAVWQNKSYSVKARSRGILQAEFRITWEDLSISFTVWYARETGLSHSRPLQHVV